MKNLQIVETIPSVDILKVIEKPYVLLDVNGKLAFNYKDSTPIISNNKIYYTTSDGEVVNLSTYNTQPFNVNLVSNTYSDGQGILMFDGDITTIGENAPLFAADGTTSNLTSITLPNSVTTINRVAFYNCNNLTSITIPNSVTSIGQMAFTNCIGLTTITIPYSVTSIEPALFKGCTGLTSITIPNAVTSLATYAFNGCTNLASITIPNSVTSLGDGLFHACEALTTINYTGTEEQWNAINKENAEIPSTTIINYNYTA